jgi:hypothetical protein
VVDVGQNVDESGHMVATELETGGQIIKLVYHCH